MDAGIWVGYMRCACAVLTAVKHKVYWRGSSPGDCGAFGAASRCEIVERDMLLRRSTQERHGCFLSASDMHVIVNVSVSCGCARWPLLANNVSAYGRRVRCCWKV